MNLDKVQEFVALDHGLATVSVARSDGSVLSSVVNAGVMDHPVDGGRVVAMVVRGSAFKLRRWREHPSASVVFRAGWQWVGVEGKVAMFGPVDPMDGIDSSKLPTVLREVFKAAGGTHDDWDEYDRVMSEEGRRAVFVAPKRVLGSQ
ncbi:MAG TPA: pyridoxamine 5'-phosphate oxidase [Actinobacteria bacterium]|nr:pyridoxamine 5'-phosphate oxidase [Actinomycetota bacterium]